ncbi:MAG: PHP domain-containing protein [Betaproteobacteria bacterium]|nr:PHP domain-containing protein [Betaproteobacteria bacterium]
MTQPLPSQNFDLHNHSIASDGLLAPRDLIALAAENGCDAIALTDHDTTDGLAEAGQTARELALRFIPGVEISVTWPGLEQDDLRDLKPVTVHIVGLGIDPVHPLLAAGLASIRDGRVERARRISADFDRIGIQDLFDDAYALAENKTMLGRTHFARAMVQRGLVTNVGKAFERYLTAGRPGYVPHRWSRLEEAVLWINAAGGVAVIAHPGRYRLQSDDMRTLLAQFKDAGGRAIEVVTGSHQTRHFREYAVLAKEFGLLASRGSDYHGPSESPYRPGTLPPLPAGLTPVWSLL